MTTAFLLLLACADPPAPKVEEEACTPQSWFVDADGDGYGGAAETGCLRPTDAVAIGGDCDDGRAEVHPGLLEVCNGFDDNCDGDTDGADADGQVQLYRDADGDGAGDSATLEGRCPAEGWVVDACDCDDRDPTVIDDLAACRAPDCGPADGILLFEDCRWSARSADELVAFSEAGVDLSLHAGLVSVCPGDWDVSLYVDAPAVVVRGVSAEESAIAGVHHTGSFVDSMTVEDLAFRGTEETGVVGYGSVALRRVEIGPTETRNDYNGWVYAAVDLEIEDSSLHDLRWSQVGSSSQACSVLGVMGYGALTVRRTTISDLDFYCEGGGFSAYNRLSGAVLWGSGGVEVVDSRVERVVGEVVSFGMGNLLSYAVVSSMGDVALEGSQIDEVTLTNSASTCQSGNCWREGSVQVVNSARNVELVDSAVSNITVALAGSSDLYEDPYIDTLEASGLLVDDDFACLSTAPGLAGVWGLLLPPGGVAARWTGEERLVFSSAGCDWGEGETENLPADFDLGFSWSAGNGASFTCTPDGCTDGAP